MKSLTEIKPNRVANRQSNPVTIAPKLTELFTALHFQKSDNQKEKFKLYLSNLSHLPEESVRYAIDCFIQGKEGDSRFVPTVAEIMNVARSHQAEQTKQARYSAQIDRQRERIEQHRRFNETEKANPDRIKEIMARVRKEHEARKAQEALNQKQREISDNEKANDIRWAQQARQSTIKACGGGNV